MPDLLTTGQQPDDLILVRSVMLWPQISDEDQRHQYRVADYINGTAFEPGPPIVEVAVETLQTLLNTPSWSELRKQSTDRTKRGVLAGHVLLFMFLMDRLKDRLPPRGASGASLSKAFALLTQWAKEGATWGDGSKFPVSDRTIRDAWRDYQGVAHFWAALDMNRVSRYAPDGRVLHPDNLPKFLETAAYLQMFATTHKVDNKAMQALTPLVDPAVMWRLDIGRHPPKIWLPSNPDAFDDAPFMRMLRGYGAI